MSSVTEIVQDSSCKWKCLARESHSVMRMKNAPHWGIRGTALCIRTCWELTLWHHWEGITRTQRDIKQGSTLGWWTQSSLLFLSFLKFVTEVFLAQQEWVTLSGLYSMLWKMLFIIDVSMHILWNIKHSKFSIRAFGTMEKESF